MARPALQRSSVSQRRTQSPSWEHNLKPETGRHETIQSQQTLFRAGEQKTEFYRIEEGVFVVSTMTNDGSLGDCRLAYPGDFLGIGFLSRHGSSATALTTGTVSCFLLSNLDALAAGSSDLYLQRADAIQREFDRVRNACVARSVLGLPIHKVANLLVVISYLEEHEGRDPNLVLDGLSCGFLAELLGLDVELLTHSLRELSILGLIVWKPGERLSIIERGRLEAFGNSVPANDEGAAANKVPGRTNPQIRGMIRGARPAVA